jgi:hypothetical protein
MLKKRREAAQHIATNLFATEAAIDAALAKAAELAGSVPQARLHAEVGANFGQDAMASAARTMSILVEARKALLETHEHLAETQRLAGLREMAFGGMMPKALESQPQLSIVHSKAA